MSTSDDYPQVRDERAALGAVYELSVTLLQGVILRSTPMSLKDANDLRKKLASQFKGFGDKGIGVHRLKLKDAKQNLLNDAQAFREHAKIIDKHLAATHPGFAHNAGTCLEAAEKLAQQAEKLVVPN